MSDYALLKKATITQNITYLAYLALLFLMIITSLPIKAQGPSLSVMLGVKLIPLLIVLPGLLLNKLRSYIWLCFIVLFYFTRAVVDSFLSLGDGMALVITIITIVLFIASMLHVKWSRALGEEL